MQSPATNINRAGLAGIPVIGRSVEMAAQKYYTEAKIAYCGKVQTRNRKGDWGTKG